MLFKYQAVRPDGSRDVGTIEAQNRDLAISALQRKGLVVVDLVSADHRSFISIGIFERVKMKEVVILSRQISTLFEAKVPVLNSFKLLAAESESEVLRRTLRKVVDDIQGGNPISASLARHPAVFPEFYVAMVRSGEESGTLSEIFSYLADYLERQYELVSKTKHALIYPAFIFLAFIGVMILMLTYVIPKLSEILLDVGGEIPFYTRVVLGASSFLISYGVFLIIAIVLASLLLWRYTLSDQGRLKLARLKLAIPYIGTLYRKFYLARISDNLDALITSGVSMIRAIEITGGVVGNDMYKNILHDVGEKVRGGKALSEALSGYDDIPRIMVQMIHVGEETGHIGSVLSTLARFYKREVEGAVESIVTLIEPILIIVLGLGVGILLISVIGPIYNISSSIQ